jgi:hypothetical protein
MKTSRPQQQYPSYTQASEASAASLQPTRASSAATAMLALSPRVTAQRQAIRAAFGDTTPQSPEPAGMPAQRLKIKSESGTFRYIFGTDFRRDHLGGKADALSTLKSRGSGVVTVIQELTGNGNEARDVGALGGYDFSIVIDVSGWMASYGEDNKPTAVEVSSVTLSGIINKKNAGIITHISSSD